MNKRRAGEVCPNGAQSLSQRRRGMPSWRVTRPKGEPISQKSADAIHPSHNHRRHAPYFAIIILLTHKILPHILPPRKRKFLSISINQSINPHLARFRTGETVFLGLTTYLKKEYGEMRKLLWKSCPEIPYRRLRSNNIFF